MHGMADVRRQPLLGPCWLPSGCRPHQTGQAIPFGPASDNVVGAGHRGSVSTTKSYVCEYVRTWIDIKVQWGLAATRGERALLRKQLRECTNELNNRSNHPLASVVL